MFVLVCVHTIHLQAKSQSKALSCSSKLLMSFHSKFPSVLVHRDVFTSIQQGDEIIFKWIKKHRLYGNYIMQLKVVIM